jgi:hypothetical protein
VSVTTPFPAPAPPLPPSAPAKAPKPSSRRQVCAICELVTEGDYCSDCDLPLLLASRAQDVIDLWPVCRECGWGDPTADPVCEDCQGHPQATARPGLLLQDLARLLWLDLVQSWAGLRPEAAQ